MAPRATDLARRFEAVRSRTSELCAPLSVEDQLVQPMADASPTKWHLAHTAWFFETLVLGDAVFDPAFAYLFNSYYETLGARVQRGRRGLLSRPSLERVHAYRTDVDRRVLHALVEDRLDAAALDRLEVGLHHEEQHQELILTDLKYVLGTQPLRPAYRDDLARPVGVSAAQTWRDFPGGIAEIGAPATGFAFDNERPRHRVLTQAFQLASRPVANAEVAAFVADGCYREPRLWLSDGWALVQAEQWQAPLYWDGGSLFDLTGMRAIDPAETACHLSYYEADAIARWLGARLPTEAEWEVAATGAPVADHDRLHPSDSGAFGEVWEWTASSYAAYPGYRPLAGALGEYNGKFMSGQQVLRGGSCFTPKGHARPSYRNFFPPSARWQMTGVRLARDLENR
ncbi:MAG: ergothioneine biosynthesis protein EgtB [Kofleriaceae bacterium]